MKHTTRLISFALALAIVIGMLPVQLSVHAAELTETVNNAEIPTEAAANQNVEPDHASALDKNFEEAPSDLVASDTTYTAQINASTTTYLYTLDKNNNATITGYSGSDATLYIPSVIDGYPVVAIGSNVFNGNAVIQTVIVPEGITSIGNYAFYQCINLETVSLPESLTSIGTYAFGYCKGLASIIIPDNVTKLGSQVFDSCTSLQEVEIPGKVTSMGIDVFKDCTGLQKVTIAEGCTVIGSDAFDGCSNLTSIRIPGTVTEIGSSAFSKCNKLKTAGPIGSGSDYEFGWSTKIPADAFYYLQGLTHAVIPEGITSIGNYAFYQCSSLETVSLPQSLTSIGSSAFNYCESLTDVYYSGGPDGWKSISIANYNDPLSNALIHYYTTGPALEQFYDSKNNTGFVDLGDHQLQISGGVTGTNPYALRLNLINKSERFQLFMSRAEEEQCLLPNVELMISLPNGIVLAENGNSRQSFIVDEIALGTTLTFDIPLTVRKISSDPINLAVYANGKLMIRQSLPIAWPPEATDTVLPDGEVNKNMANSAGQIELVSGDYGKILKITSGQNVKVNPGVELTVDELIVEGDLIISGDVSAKYVKVLDSGSLYIYGSLTVENKLTLDKYFPSMWLYGTLNASKVQISQGKFSHSSGTAKVGTLIINYDGRLDQTGGNLIVRDKMEVSSDSTSTLTGGTLWLEGNFKQSWHNGNFKASGTHATIRQDNWSGSKTKFKSKDVYFNNLYVDQDFAESVISSDMGTFVREHVGGEFCSAALDLKNRTFTVGASLDPQFTWETGLLKAYDTKATAAVSDATLYSLLGKERYNFVVQAVANWYCTSTSPLIENDFTELTARLEYMKLEMDDDIIIIYTDGTQYGEHSFFGRLKWYGRVGNRVYTKEHSQEFGLSTITSINNFKRQVAVYLSTSAVENITTMLGKETVKNGNKVISKLVSLAMENWEQANNINDKIEKFGAWCERIQDEKDLPVIKAGKSMESQKTSSMEVRTDAPAIQVQEILIPPMVVMNDSIGVSTANTPQGEDDGSDGNQPENDLLTEPVILADERLAMLVRIAMGKTAEYTITHADVQKITKLNLSNYSIGSLEGLEAFVNLTSLNLSGNNFYDLTALSALTQLEELDISGNRIMDLSALNSLTNLTNLSVADNPLTDISVLTDLPQLLKLDLQNCNITDFSAMQSLTSLQELDISGISMPGGDLTAIAAQKSLTALTADQCGLTSLNGLDSESLAVLSAQYNQLTSLGTLKIGSLTTALLEGNQLTDISALADATLLTSLNLGGNELTDESVAPLAGAINLQQLDLKANQLGTLAFVSGIPALQRLDVSANLLTDLTGVAGHTALTVLSLDECSLTDELAAQMIGLSALQQLQMQYNELTSAAFLAQYTALEYADLSNNDIALETVPAELDAVVNIENAAIEAKVLELAASTDTLLVGESVTVSCYVYPALASGLDLRWSSDEPDVATVSELGVVKAIAPGIATITAVSTNGKTASIEIQVSDAEGGSEHTVTYTSASISLAGDIGVNYYVQLSDGIVADKDAYMQFTVAGQIQTVPLADAVVSTGNDGTVTYRFTCKVAAKQMTEQITGQMHLSDGTAVGDAKVYSVKAYCDAAIPIYSQYAAYADLVDLMKAMLNYGAYSQIQFNYNTDTLANQGVETALPALTADDVSAYAHGATGIESGISVASVSLLLESTTTIRFYFNLDGSKPIDAYTFYVDGVEVVPVESNGQYYVDKVNVAAKDLDEMVTVTVGGLTVRYCGLSYVRQVAVLYPSYYDESLINVAKALYAYNQAANAYFA